MSNFDFQYKQELDIFLSLCPDTLLSKFFSKGRLHFFEYAKIAKMLRVLGFVELCEVYILTDHKAIRDKTRIVVDKNVHLPEYDEKPLVREFIANIYSPDLKAMFLHRINEYYSTNSST